MNNNIKAFKFQKNYLGCGQEVLHRGPEGDLYLILSMMIKIMTSKKEKTRKEKR